MIGTTLGNYEIQSLLGSGGMASVYQALDRRLGRLVALKVLSPATAAQPGFVARFQQEARLIASLRHPNIVQIYDLGEQDGHWYMVQELLPGPTLVEQLRAVAAQNSKLPREQVIDVVRQLAAALDAAHAAGVIHRDVKPGNAIWNAGGTLVLTDFGIAKSTQLPANHTQTGLVIGTPSYLSPEQAQGQSPTASSDIYSLGVVLYELIAGHVPFRDSSALGAVYGHLQEAPPPLRPLRPDLPFAVERVVLQALAKDPAARFRSAGALAKALEQAWLPGGQALAGADIPLHERSTQLWVAPGQPTIAQPAARSLAVPAAAAPITAAPAAPPRTRFGLILGGLLAAAVVAGLLFSRIGDGQTAALDPTPESPAAGVVVEAPTPSAAPEATAAPEPTAALEATAVPEPTSLPEPTSPPEPTPVPEPTAAPEPTSPPEPTPVPEPAPAQLAPAVAELRALLLAGQADGRAGKDADRLLDTLDEASQALLDSNTRRATDRLRDLQKRLTDRGDEIDTEFAGQALDGISAIANQYDLRLPPAKKPKKD